MEYCSQSDINYWIIINKTEIYGHNFWTVSMATFQ